MKKILLGLCLLMSAALLQAADTEEEVALTARELLAECEQGILSMEPTQACMQYVFGLVQTVVMLGQMEDAVALFCIDPARDSLQEVTTTVADWLKSQSSRLDEEAYILVSEALNANYPCGAGKRS